MAERTLSFFIVKRQDIELAVLIHDSPQVHDLSVDLSGSRHSGKSFADIFCDIVHAHGLIILFERAVF